MRGANNPMFGKNIKEHMSTEAYEAWCASQRRPRPQRRGFHLTAEQRAFVGKVSHEYQLKNGSPQAKQVVCLNSGISYKSMKEAEADTGANHNTIARCCNGTARYAGRDNTGERLVWKLHDDYIYMSLDDIRSAIRAAQGRR